MKILVTGHKGFIGRNLEELLQEQGHQVIGMDLPEGDISQRDLVLHQVGLSLPDAIVHLAAQPGIHPSIQNPAWNFDTNVGGTFNLLYAANMFKVKRFVFASSGAAGRCDSPYAAGKAAGEAYCRGFTESFGLETVALRFTNVYGPYSQHKTSVIADWIRAIVDNRQIPVIGGVHQFRDFIYSRDVAGAIEAALVAPENNVAGQVFDVGTGKLTSLADVLAALERVAGKKLAYDLKPPREGDPEKVEAPDIARTMERLGWSPAMMLESGLWKTLEWFQFLALGRK